MLSDFTTGEVSGASCARQGAETSAKVIAERQKAAANIFDFITIPPWE
jgi:hypothetical protein